MARKKKDDPAPPPPETTLLMPTPKVVQDLVKAKRNLKTNVGELTGTYAEKIGKAVADKHLDKKAFSIVASLDTMSDERLGITYFHLLAYMDSAGITKRAKAQNTMFGENEMGDNAIDDAGETDTNVTSIGTAGRRVAEQAGAKL